MAKLGSFGAAARELDPEAERDTFDFFGSEFVVVGRIPALLGVQLGAVMTGKIGEIEGNAAVWEALRCALTVPGSDDGKTLPDHSEFDRFYRIAIRRNCNTDELLKLVFALLGIQIDFPTEQQPASPDGSLPTSPSSSSSASDTPDSPRLKSVDEVLGG
jgi:hypothetical protein